MGTTRIINQNINIGIGKRKNIVQTSISISTVPVKVVTKIKKGIQKKKKN